MPGEDTIPPGRSVHELQRHGRPSHRHGRALRWCHRIRLNHNSDKAADAIATVSTIGYGGFLIGPPLIGLLAQEIGIGRALWVLPVLGLAIAVLSPVVAPPPRVASH